MKPWSTSITFTFYYSLPLYNYSHPTSIVLHLQLLPENELPPPKGEGPLLLLPPLLPPGNACENLHLFPYLHVPFKKNLHIGLPSVPMVGVELFWEFPKGVELLRLLLVLFPPPPPPPNGVD